MKSVFHVDYWEGSHHDERIFVAQVREVPGIMDYGASEREAIDNVAALLAEYLKTTKQEDVPTFSSTDKASVEWSASGWEHHSSTTPATPRAVPA